MTDEGIPAGLFHVIKRAADPQKDRRFQTLAELKQAVVSAFDIILGRVQGLIKCRSKLDTICSRLLGSNQFDVAEVTDFIDSLATLDFDDQDAICQSLERGFFAVIAQEPLDDKRQQLLDSYAAMVKKGNYGWSFAEQIADNMQQIVAASAPQLAERAMALDLAIEAAVSQNRFAAMDTCVSMITGIADENLADHVRPVLLKYPGTFVARIQPSQCRSDIIGQAIRELTPKADV